MGNNHSENHPPHHKLQTGASQQHQIRPEVQRAFDEFSRGEPLISQENFKEKVGNRLGESFWTWICKDGNGLSLKKFNKAAIAFSLISSNSLVQILMPPENLLHSCFETIGIISDNQDDLFIHEFIKQMTSNGVDNDSVSKWIDENCPRLTEPIRNKMHGIFHGKFVDLTMKCNSEILRPTQMFILRQTLPTTIFWPKPDSHTSTGSQEEGEWILLYSSPSNGLSINRFQTNVFDYKGPTVAIFRLNTGELSAIAADEEWRHSCKPFGGPNSILFKFIPTFKRVDLAPPAIYCNFKNRSSKLGIKYGNEFSINEDMSDVQQIEVWGCAGMEILNEQKKMKVRHNQQAERNAKVPLPGNWEENPDKTLLELGGVKFYSNDERRE